MNTLYVSKTGTITSLSQALSLINDNFPTTIILDEGIYFEKICICNDNITIKGACKENTLISFNDFSKKIHQDGKEFNTFRTYTVQILGNNVHFENITIENSCTDSSKYHQAVALHVMGDKVSFKNCDIIGGQDTIFLGPLPNDLKNRYNGLLLDKEIKTPILARHYFENCHIFGDVDFIFGCGNSVFDNCEITCINEHGYISAPSTEKEQEYGFTFNNCSFNAISHNKSFYLARPWRDYGVSTFINCTFEKNIIHDDIFNKWNDTNRDKTCRFAIYNPKGLNLDKIVEFSKILSKEEADKYTLDNIFNDWKIKG